MTHDRFRRSTQCTNGTHTHRVSSTGDPQSDGTLKNAVSKKIRHYRQFYSDKSDPVIFLSVSVNTSGHIYEDFVRLLFLHAKREASILVGELPEESDQFRFLRAARLATLKGTVGLILAKVSAMRVTIPIDLSTRPFIPLSRFFNSRRPGPLLNPSLVIFSQQSDQVTHGLLSFLKSLFSFTVNNSSFVTFIPLVLAFFFIRM